MVLLVPAGRLPMVSFYLHYDIQIRTYICIRNTDKEKNRYTEGVSGLTESVVTPSKKGKGVLYFFDVAPFQMFILYSFHRNGQLVR